MSSPLLCRFIRTFLLVLSSLYAISTAHAQGPKHGVPGVPPSPSDADHVKERNAWFMRGRVAPGKSSAELRRHAVHMKMQMRTQRMAYGAAAAASAGTWIPLGPVPLASDASGTGLQDYHQVSGRATAVAIDPADSSGNTVYLGGAQGGVWKSTNAVNSAATGVTWTPVTDNQATLSVGSIAIQPGNNDPSKSVILIGTGEANNSGDSYFGLGILRSADAGNTWTLIPTANSGALSFSGLGGTHMAFGSPGIVVAAMATTAEGMIDGAVTANTKRGLYTSLDAGETWTYNALLDPGGLSTDATSSTAVAYNAAAGLFFAAVRYHGFYSSPDGTHWSRLTNQPAGTVLSAAACPPLSTSNNRACPIYRSEITVVPGRNEMYVWFISLDSSGSPVSQGIWQSLNGGASWTRINDSGITNCGDASGCGVEQGYYNLDLLAVPNGGATDLYAGAINLYKCSLSSINPACSSTAFVNLTHAYGCDPLAAPAHVHPDQHGLDFTIPAVGTDSGNALLYFANDGGIYRALNGFTGLKSDSCSGTNNFDDLNQNLGSMAQFVSFSQHPNDASTLLGGTQDNGSPATSSAQTSTSWINVNGGDGGFNAIDPTAATNWFVSNPDIPPGGLNIKECSSGINCHEGDFNVVIDSSSVGGDDGAFYVPYILDPQSSQGLLVGTCRVWRGPRLGGAYTLLSPNFETLGTGLCTGNEVNVVRSLAAGGPADSNGSKVIYATTDGPGPLLETSPIGGRVWVTPNATAGTLAFADVTQNINPNQFPISNVAIDVSDPTGNTAFVTVMGFTGGSGHVWKTTDAGSTWSDFTGILPDSPVNAVVVDPGQHIVYVGSDVGVFQSGTDIASWTEVGPSSSGEQSGFLPNVAVTALGIFNAGSQKFLRASTYGRGIWQYNLLADFQVAISNVPPPIFPTQSAVFNGTATALNGFSNAITLSCVAGTTPAPSSCTSSPAVLTPTTNTPFSVTAGGASGTYNFDLQAAGSDSNSTTHRVGLTLQVIDFGLTPPSPNAVTVAPGTTSSPVNFQVTAAGPFSQSVSVSCSVNISGGGCNLTPGTAVSPTSSTPINMTASIVAPAGTSAGSYTANLRAASAGAPAPRTSAFSVNVSTTADFILSPPKIFPTVNAGSAATGAAISIAAVNGFAGTVNLTCSLISGNGTCSINPVSISAFPDSASVTVNATTLAAGSYQLSVQGTSGSTTHTLAVAFNVADYQLSGTQSLTMGPGAQGTANLTLTPSTFYSGKVNATCDAHTLANATCTFSPANPITVNTSAVPLTATIAVPAGATAGLYNISVNTRDTSGAPVHNFAIALTVGQDFSITSSTASQTVAPGQTSGAYNLTIQPAGASFTSAVTFSCLNGLPSGAQCNFTPNPVTPGSSTVPVAMIVSTATTTPVGPFTIGVTATSGSLSHSLTESLVVGGNDFTLAVAQLPRTTDEGAQATSTLTLTPGTSQSIKVNATCDSSTLSAICSLSPPSPITVNPGTPAQLTARINVPNNAAPGTYNIGVSAQETTGTFKQNVSFPLTVIQDFSVNSSTISQTVTAGQTTGAYNLTVVPIGASFTDAVTLSCSGLPDQTQCLFNPSAPVIPGNNAASVVMSIATIATTTRLWPAGQRAITYALWLTMPGIVIAWGAGDRTRRRKRPRLSTVPGLLLLALTLASCGGGTGGGGGSHGHQGTKPGTYTITVVGTAGAVSHSTTVGLVVSP